MKKVDINITYKEYKKMQKHFPYRRRKIFFITALIISISFLLALLPPDPVSLSDYLISSIVLVFGAYIIIFTIDKITIPFRYKKLSKSNDNIKYSILFYPDHIEKKGKSLHLKAYATVKTKLILKENTFYLVLDKENIIPIPKEEYTDIIKEFCKNIKRDAFTENAIIKEPKRTSENNPLRIVMLILFIFTILSLWIGLFISNYLFKKSGVPSALFTNYMWGMFLCLPIPITSIILGLIFKRKGLKCKKNIVAGFIIGIFLTIFGSFPFLLDFKSDYALLYNYEEIINSSLPTNGEFYQIIWDESYLQNHKTSIAIFTQKEEINSFYEEIEKNPNWLTINELNSHLSYIFITPCSSEKLSCLYSIYFPETNQYNTFPTTHNSYYTYTMMVDPNNNSLQIDEFSFRY